MRLSPGFGWYFFLFLSTSCNGFVPRYTLTKPKVNHEAKSFVTFPHISQKEFSLQSKTSMSTRTVLSMVNDDDGPAFLTVAGVLLAIVIIVGTSLAPTMDMMNGSGSSMDYNLSDSVVTRQDTPNKMQDYSNPNDKLSRSKIQEKLNRVPVFYLADSDLNMKEKIYLSFQDASAVASSSDSNLKVKCTTLDQVT